MSNSMRRNRRHKNETSEWSKKCKGSGAAVISLSQIHYRPHVQPRTGSARQRAADPGFVIKELPNCCRHETGNGDGRSRIKCGVLRYIGIHADIFRTARRLWSRQERPAHEGEDIFISFLTRAHPLPPSLFGGSPGFLFRFLNVTPFPFSSPSRRSLPSCLIRAVFFSSLFAVHFGRFSYFFRVCSLL